MRTLGQRIKEQREAIGLVHEDMLLRSGYTVAFISRLENDYILPPNGEEWAILLRGLCVQPNSELWVELTDLAGIQRGELPKDAVQNSETFQKILALYQETFETHGGLLKPIKLKNIEGMVSGREIPKIISSDPNILEKLVSILEEYRKGIA